MLKSDKLFNGLILLAALWASPPARAGSFTSTFTNSNQSGFTLNGSGTLTDGNLWMPVVGNGVLLLSTNQNSLVGSFVLDDLDNGQAIEGFTATFKVQFGPGTTTPADGLFFGFSPNIYSGATFNEEGPSLAAGGLGISFDTYNNNLPDTIGIDLKAGAQTGPFNGTEIAIHPYASFTNMVRSQFVDVFIQLNRNGTLNMSFGGQVIFTNQFVTGWSPVNGQFGFGARTGGANEVCMISNLTITTTLAGATAAPTITAQPQSQTINEGGAATFTVGYAGTPPLTFQWAKNGVDIPYATSPTLTAAQLATAQQQGLTLQAYGPNNILALTQVPASDSGAKYTCTIANGVGSVTSQAATLTVTADTARPTVTKISADMSFTNVLVWYSKAVSDTTALKASNYALDQGVTVLSVIRVDSQTVRLTTSKFAEGGTFNLTINGVQDTASTPNTITANTKASFKSFVFVSGAILHKKYNSVTDGVGANTTGLFNDPRYPSIPDRQELAQVWEYPANGAARVLAADPARNYFDTLEGDFIAPKTGNYIFFIAGADRFWLYLSTDDNPANLNLIAAEPGGWTTPRAWNTGQGGIDMTQLRSDSYGNSAWPTPNSISLVAGKKYYMLSIHHDPSWCGADDHSVTYKMDTDPDPLDGDISKISGNIVGNYLDPTGASVNLTQQPQNVTALQGATATFSTAVIGASAYGSTVFYQWQAALKNSTTWTNISGASAAAYQTLSLTAADNGTQFRMVATVPPLSATSSVATLTVNTDITPPVVTVGAMPDSATGVVDVGIAFNKPVDEVSGRLISNYSVSPGTITGITWYTNRFTANSKNPLVMSVKQSALLKVTGLSGSGTLTIKNVADTFGNKITSTNVPFTVASSMKWGALGANELGGVNAVVPVAPNGFDVYSDGIGEWATYDEATFVYEQVTGDFDKKVRVEYQDGSSQWARAGLIVRDVTNFGVDRATQTGSAATAAPYDGLAGRYQKVHGNPVGATLTGPGTGGNALWEGNRRLDTGSATTSALTGANAAPPYPNAWCRIQRVGQTFTIFRSSDGMNWVTLGATTWGVTDVTKTPMPATVYVGPEYSPENGNITQVADRGTFLARFRDYGDYVAIFAPQLKAVGDPSGKVTITWTTGTLVSASTVKGPYAPVTGATSPYSVTPSAGATMFYQVKP